MSDVLVQRARALARSLPRDLRVVGLLAELPDDQDSLAAIVELASHLGRDRRTLLANLAGSSSGLDGFLESGEKGGLAAVLAGEGKLGEVAVRPGTHRFLYLPAGDVSGVHPWLGAGADPSSAPTADASPSAGDSPLGILLERLTQRIRRADAILLLYMPPELTRAADVAALLDGLVSLSGEPAPEVRQAGLPVVGVEAQEVSTPRTGSGDRPRWELVEDADAVQQADEDAGEVAEDRSAPDSAGERWEQVASPGAGEGELREESRWRRHRRSGKAPWGRIALGVVAVLLLAGGWWTFARTAADGAETVAPASVAEGDPGGEPVEVADAAVGEDSANGLSRPPAETVVGSAPELTHSVLVASYASLARARALAEAWTREDGILYFVAPTRIDGDVYHRLFAGALPSSGEAERAMERLVQLGRKDSARAWDARPAGLSHRLRATRDEAEATELRDRLAGDGVPAYLLPAVADGDTVYQVYAGAYERAGSSALSGVLREAGRDSDLVTRRGAPRTP